MYLAKNLKTLRAQNGETQNDIASLLGVTAMTISRYESGEIIPSLPMVVKLSEHYSRTLDELVLTQIDIDLPQYVKNMVYLRKKHGMSEGDIAELLGVMSYAVCQFEIGLRSMSVESLDTAAEFFGVTLDAMVREDLAKGDDTYGAGDSGEEDHGNG